VFLFCHLDFSTGDLVNFLAQLVTCCPAALGAILPIDEIYYYLTRMCSSAADGEVTH
jgi:hypothetical protein